MISSLVRSSQSLSWPSQYQSPPFLQPLTTPTLHLVSFDIFLNTTIRSLKINFLAHPPKETRLMPHTFTFIQAPLRHVNLETQADASRWVVWDEFFAPQTGCSAYWTRYDGFANEWNGMRGQACVLVAERA